MSEVKPKKLWFRAKPNRNDSVARPRKLWFRAKTYGWGWTPVSWQGWLILAIYLFCVAYYAKDVGSRAGSNFEKLPYFFVGLGGLSSLLVWICYKKGERPKPLFRRDFFRRSK
ncbi:MAG: hypothetical protein Q7R62_00240 [bacterium]|nr:hypothetical protein [bacterium]